MGKEREYLWDNIKAVLIILVVIGHSIEMYLDSNVFKSIYIFICHYLFLCQVCFIKIKISRKRWFPM